MIPTPNVQGTPLGADPVGSHAMKEELLKKVLACPTLPSLPAVALRVIELTSDPNVKMSELASTIQNDQGLAAKILKTVNSSFYGLRQPCATINKALVMLGLGPVKTLALGFSLISSVGMDADSRFNYVAYWRRGLYTAVAAKAIAEAAKRNWADEVFLAGLLQDLGEMALFRALGKDYLAVQDKTRGDHRQLVKHELADLEVQHPEVGAMLAERWKLPKELVLPVRYHERPTAAPAELTDLVRCVGLANWVHDSMTGDEPAAALQRVYDRGEQWFALDAAAMDAVVRRVAEGAKELSRLFNLDTGANINPEELLQRAQEQQKKLEAQANTDDDAGLHSLLAGSTDTDPLTGLRNRTTFESSLRRLVADSKGEKRLGVLNICIDHFREVAAANGLEAADEVVVRVASLLSTQFQSAACEVFRLKPEIFAVIGEEGSLGAFRIAADNFIDELALSNANAVPITVSCGFAVLRTTNPADLITAGARALQAAVKMGGNRFVDDSAKVAA
jgi:diguanylate cyclase (GGDEF)-like protein